MHLDGHIMQGQLQLKTKGTITDSWDTYMCAFNTESNVMIVKRSDKILWEKRVVKAGQVLPVNW
jgi:hypothetical protein